jgi:hypothetical protein
MLGKNIMNSSESNSLIAAEEIENLKIAISSINKQRPKYDSE